MKVLSNLIEIKKLSAEQDRQDLLEKLNTIQIYQDWFHERSLELEKAMPKLLDSFKSIGLEITTITSIKKRGLYDLPYIVKESDTLFIELRASMVGRRKPILFSGYTASGAGKNSKKLSELENKLKEEFFALTNLKISINKFSLEIKNREEKENVMLVLSF